MSRIYTLLFTDQDACDKIQTGGKGANLATLTQAGFRVPTGFCVTTAAYQDHIAQDPALEDLLYQLDALAPDHRSSHLQDIRHRIAALPLPVSLQTEIRDHLAVLDPRGQQGWAVRSSGTQEDQQDAAFAGQHDTFLNCRGPERVLEKIREGFVSLWSDRAVAYRTEKAIPLSQAGMACVVQTMVPCSAAGVGFSMNPITGALDELVVNAHPGLGEAVVDGSTEVDQWRIRKADGVILEATMGQKSALIQAKRDGSSGTEATPLSAAETHQPCLSATELHQVQALVQAAETQFRFPQDIEWGFAEGVLWLLQSRPVTVFPARWTRDESAERFPTAMTPLSWALIDQGFHHSLRYSLTLMGLPPLSGKWFDSFDGWVYGNQTAVELYLGQTSALPKDKARLLHALPQILDQSPWIRDLPDQWLEELGPFLRDVSQLGTKPLNPLSPEAVWAHVQKVAERGRRYFQPNIAISITQARLRRVLLDCLTALEGPDMAAEHVDQLLSGAVTMTGHVNAALGALADTARTTAGLPELLSEMADPVRYGDGRGLETFPAFAKAFRRFLRQHGHREVDIDPIHPTWGEAPWQVLGLLIPLMAREADEPAAQSLDAAQPTHASAQKLAARLCARLPADQADALSELISLAQRYTELDDLEHYHSARLTPVLRRGLLQLGGRLVAAGVIEDPLDVFYATPRQLSQAAETGAWGALQPVIQAAKEAHFRNAAETPVWDRESIGSAPLQQGADDDALQGVPGSAGQVEGPVFVVRGPSDFAAFPKGAILVAPTTNPTWTPLFGVAKAVVTQSGGPLSHGAVSARELGLPAVMAVRRVFDHLKTGDRIRVDGTRGLITRLSDPTCAA